MTMKYCTITISVRDKESAFHEVPTDLPQRCSDMIMAAFLDLISEGIIDIEVFTEDLT